MNSLLSLLANKTFQVFIMVLTGIVALTVLLALGTISYSEGFPSLLAVIGFGIGVPVSTSGTSGS